MFETTIRVRYRDLDTNGHVNNAVYGTYLEETRDRFYRDTLDAGLDELHTVLVSSAVEYERPVDPGDRVVVTLTLPDFGESSIPMAYDLRLDGGARVATGETVQVWVDEDGGSTAIPDWVREPIEAA
jgi:acyl-CoA thioester hydrolase